MTSSPLLPLDRRTLLKTLLTAGAGWWVAGCATRGRSGAGEASPAGPWLRLPATVEGLPEGDVPAGQRLPRGFTARPLDAQGAAPVFSWRGFDDARAPRAGRLRVAVAVDFREERAVKVALAKSGESLGAISIKYAYCFQPFELVLAGDQVRAALREGVRLDAGKGALPLWIFDEHNRDGARQFFAPHLLLEFADGDPVASFRETLMSEASLQPFGWIEGCVLDGLQDLARLGAFPQAQSALDAHLAHFLDPNGRLIFQNLRSRPSDDHFEGIESTLPMAVIAAQRPGHPLIERVLAFWQTKTTPEGVICDNRLVSAEGSYTVAYPLAVIAVQAGREDLARQSLQQIEARMRWLPFEGELYLRSPIGGGQRTFRNWARAYAWYMLGLTRTWVTLAASHFAKLDGMDALRSEAERMAEDVRRRRQPDGLWSCFLDRPETGIDTSGSAGIAAALALGVRRGLLAPGHLGVAQTAEQALLSYLSPDGLLTGVAQHNAGGEALQSGGYRVISQMGMGLLAQLQVSLRS